MISLINSLFKKHTKSLNFLNQNKYNKFKFTSKKDQEMLITGELSNKVKRSKPTAQLYKKRKEEYKNIVKDKLPNDIYEFIDTSIKFNDKEDFQFDDELIKYFKFIHLCNIFQSIELTLSRNEKISFLSKFFSMIVNRDYQNYDFLLKIVRLILPELGLSNKSQKNKEKSIHFIYKFENIIEGYIKSEFEMTNEDIKNEILNNNDLTNIILTKFTPSSSCSHVNLSIDDIISIKDKMINTIGTGSVNDKVELLKTIYNKCKSKVEAYYITKIFLCRLNLGIAEKGVISAIENIVPEYERTAVEYYSECLLYLKNNLFQYNYSKYLLSNNFEPGNIFDVCLSKPEYIETLLYCLKKKKETSFLSEIKYDGERTQIHYNKEKDLLLFISRNHENQDGIYSEIISRIKKSLYMNKTIKSFILDGEIVIYDLNTKSYGCFQELRKKETVNLKHIQFKIVLFDILYFNGNRLYDNNLEIRKEILNEHFNVFNDFSIEKGRELLVNDKNTLSLLEEEYNKARLIGCEGLIIKILGKNSKYDFSKQSWYKIKAMSLNSVDTLDLVPLGATYGLGHKRHLFSSFLVGVYNPKTNLYNLICTVGTGFKDEELEEITNRLSSKIKITTDKEYFEFSKAKCSVYFEPSEVWEIGFDSFMKSPKYSVLKDKINESRNGGESGVTLRFPRFVRLRDDKKPNQASTDNNVWELYKIMNAK